MIEKNLTHTQLSYAKTQALSLKKEYGYEETKISLGAINRDNNKIHKDKDIDYKLTLNKQSQKKINYPQKALKKSGRGWVELSYSIYPDGTVQDINIMEQYPHKLFAPSAIEFISNQKFDFIKNNVKITPNKELYIRYRVRYGVRGTSLLNSKTKLRIQKLLKQALAGNLEAQHLYTELYFNILNGGGGVSGTTINKWLLRSAQFGIPEAQFRLGRNIYYGIYCQSEKQKGLDWIIRAAENNIANAQYLTYYLLKTENLNNISNKSFNYWLYKAAQNNSQNGQIKYAKYIAAKLDSTQKDRDQAMQFLDKYAKIVAKTTDWYQTRALLLSQSNHHADAVLAIKKAIQQAKISHWDLTELKKQKAMIQNHKNT